MSIIDKVINKLNIFFGKEYEESSLYHHSPVNPETLEDKINNLNHKIDMINNNNNRSYVYSPPFWNYWYPFYFPSSTTTNHHYYNTTTKQKDDKEEENKKNNNITFGIIILSVVTVISAWVFAKDGYFILLRSGIEKDVKKLEMYGHKNNCSKDVSNVIINYNKWLKEYKKRVKKDLYIKSSLMLSGVTTATGFILSNNYVVGGGIIASIISVSVTIYYICSRNGWTKYNERKYYYESLRSLYELKNTKENPPLYSDFSNH